LSRRVSGAVTLLWACLSATGGALAGEPEPPPISDRDVELLEDIDLLMDWDLLREWDPDEDLPLPPEESEPAQAAPIGPEGAR
jgi:hypothetical protein